MSSLKPSYYCLIFLMATFFFSCKKNEVPIVGTDSTGNIIGNSTTSNDTTKITVGTLLVKYSKTDPCYPDNEVFTFTATSSQYPSSANTYYWYFGDGGSATGINVQHAYNATGAYAVLLEIKNSNDNLLASTTFSVQAWGQQIKLVPSFYTQFDFSTNTNYVTFNSTSSINKGSVINYLWTWGDGTTYNSSNGLIRHQFPAVAKDTTYPVKLTITADAGCTADTVIKVTIPGTYPITGDFNAVAYNACSNEYFKFTPTATNVPAGAVYYWNFSTGYADTTASLPIQYQFQYMNDYDVIMKIYLNSRLIYTTHKMVSAKGPNAAPQARFITAWISTNGNISETWGFTSQSTILHGGISGYYWNLGNGNIDTTYDVFTQSTYQKNTAPSNYTIRLIVNGNGCADTAYNTIQVSAK